MEDEAIGGVDAEFEAGPVTRRTWLKGLMAGGASLFFATALSACIGRRARARRRRIRRRVAWRMVAGRRVVVVPVDIDADDEVEFEDGSVGKVVSKTENQITVNVGGTTKVVDAAYEGEIGGD